MWIEVQATLTAMAASLVFGYLYEVIRRSIVLGVSFILLCWSRLMPFIPGWEDSNLVTALSRVFTVVMVQGII